MNQHDRLRSHIVPGQNYYYQVKYDVTTTTGQQFETYSHTLSWAQRPSRRLIGQTALDVFDDEIIYGGGTIPANVQSVSVQLAHARRVV